jgi:hypothetical protein
LEDIDQNTLNEVQIKQMYIIMALCLRIFLEYNIKENPPKKKEKIITINTPRKNSIKSEDKNNLYESEVYPENNKFILNDEKKPELKDLILHNNNDNIIISTNNNNFINNYKTNYSSNTSNISYNSNNFKTNNTDSSINEQNINVNNDLDIDNIIDNNMLEKHKNIDENIDNEVNETLNSKITEKYQFSDYFSFQKIFQNLLTTKKFTDYSFKSILLFLLEKNNGINIQQKIRYKFILKTKKYEDLKDKDYDHFLKINYYNEETKEQFIQLLNILENNNKYLTRISYEILIYLIINIAKQRQNKCVFRHFLASRKICGKIFFLIFLNNKESSETLIKASKEMLELILPYHKKTFIYSFVFNLMEKDELVEYGKVLINIIIKINFREDKNFKFFY